MATQNLNQIGAPDSFIPTSEQAPFTQDPARNDWFSGALNFIKPAAEAYLDFERQDAEIDAIRTQAQQGNIQQTLPQGNTAPVAKSPIEGILKPSSIPLLLGGILAIGVIVYLIRK